MKIRAVCLLLVLTLVSLSLWAQKSEQTIEELQGVFRHQVTVIWRHEAVPGLFGVLGHDGFHVRVQVQVVLIQVIE